MPLREIEWALRENAMFCQRVTERVRDLLSDGGRLSPDANIARWNRISDKLGEALTAESARWGDYRRAIPPRNEAAKVLTTFDWDVTRRKIARYFEDRTAALAVQLAENGLIAESIATEILATYGPPLDKSGQCSDAARR